MKYLYFLPQPWKGCIRRTTLLDVGQETAGQVDRLNRYMIGAYYISKNKFENDASCRVTLDRTKIGPTIQDMPIASKWTHTAESGEVDETLLPQANRPAEAPQISRSR